jgi:hypothetical protein
MKVAALLVLVCSDVSAEFRECGYTAAVER